MVRAFEVAVTQACWRCWTASSALRRSLSLGCGKGWGKNRSTSLAMQSVQPPAPADDPVRFGPGGASCCSRAGAGCWRTAPRCRSATAPSTCCWCWSIRPPHRRARRAVRRFRSLRASFSSPSPAPERQSAPSRRTVTGLVTPDEKPERVVQRVNPEPFIEVVEQRVGSLKIDSTPEGAEAISIDGRSYGKTPLTVPDLEVGTVPLVLKSTAGTITRRGDD